MGSTTPAVAWKKFNNNCSGLVRSDTEHCRALSGKTEFDGTLSFAMPHFHESAIIGQPVG
jgi:hypothetical protein